MCGRLAGRLFEQACLCGRGCLVILVSADDRIETEIDCPQCSRHYVLDVHGTNKVRLYRRSEYVAHTAVVSERAARIAALWETPAAMAVIRPLAHELAAAGGVAACYRWLRKHGLLATALPAFGSLSVFQRLGRMHPDVLARMLVQLHASRFPTLAGWFPNGL